MKSNKPKEELLIGKEYPTPGEEKIALKIVELLQMQMLRLNKGKKMQRQIHPKMNGCVKAEFIINKGLPENLKVGIFKNETSFPAWIRFSNGNTKPLPDYKKDVRGFAIKIMNVPGEKIPLENSPAINQDFILMNPKSFVAKKLEDFYQVLQVLTMLPFKGPVLKKVHYIFKNAYVFKNGANTKVLCNHPFELDYHSTTPYRFGDETHAVKYSIFPSKENEISCVQNNTDPDFLRLRMQETLLKNEICFDFCIQFQTDAERMPVEDPTVAWTSPFHKLATIRIPIQIFDTPEQREFGDNLSFNVWHSLPEHRPIGNFNRARKIIYERMYNFRHEQNNIPLTEPTADKNFFNHLNFKQDAEQQPTNRTANVS